MPPFHTSIAEACLVSWPKHVIPGWGKLVDVALLPLTGRVECMLRYPPLEWTRRLRLWADPIE